MQLQTSSRLRTILPIARACVIGLLFWSCSSSPQDQTAVSYSCATPPADLTTCSADADCATFAQGCFCGAQPVNGVAHKYAAAAQSCEDTAAGACTLGCANDQGGVTQDGTKVAAGTRTAAHCVVSGGTRVCQSFVPPPGGSGDPVPTGW
jgi:hypothetical protein